MSRSETQTQAAPEIDLDVEIGRRVHQRMWEQHVKQGDLASALGIDQTAVSKKNRGGQSYSVKQLLTIAEYLNTSVAYLIGEEGNGSNTPGGISRESRFGSVHEVDFRARRLISSSATA